MGDLAIALPCVQGGAEKLRALAAECSGPRSEEFEEFHARVGLTGERWFLQQTPDGTVVIVTLEGDPLGAVQTLAASDHDFDRWFIERLKEVHGVDFGEPLPLPPPELVFEG